MIVLHVQILRQLQVTICWQAVSLVTQMQDKMVCSSLTPMRHWQPLGHDTNIVLLVIWLMSFVLHKQVLVKFSSRTL